MKLDGGKEKQKREIQKNYTHTLRKIQEGARRKEENK